MNQNKNGIPVQLNVKKLKQRASSEQGKIHIEKKIQRLYEFEKRGNKANGYARSTIFTPFITDEKQLKQEGYKAVGIVAL